MDMKDLMYSEIDQLGRDYIKTKINDNILNSEGIIKQIFEKCVKSRGTQNLTPSEFISLSESLMHYLLAITITPSQRKITINKTEISILVPSAGGLKNGGDRVLVIQFLKGDKIENEHTVSDLLEIQPTLDNIWLVSYCPIITLFPLKNFIINTSSIETNEVVQPFSRLMIQVNAFLNKINYTGFRIL
jgi:hypothetical protein